MNVNDINKGYNLGEWSPNNVTNDMSISFIGSKTMLGKAPPGSKRRILQGILS